MARESTSHLSAFLAVARSRSFTRAAAALGVSPSALSHTIRGLEERLGLQLLTRTTRSVSLTEAGERLLRTTGPLFDGIDDALAALTALREKPAGALRLVAGFHAAETVLWPAIRRLRLDHPDITAEIDRITAADIQRLAQQLLVSDNMALTLLGNLGTLKIDRADLAC